MPSCVLLEGRSVQECVFFWKRGGYPMVPNIKVSLTQTRTEWTLDSASSSRTHTTEHMGVWRTSWWNAIYCRCSSLQHLRRKRACTLDPQTSIESKQECNVSCLSAYIPPGLSYKGSLANSNVLTGGVFTPLFLIQAPSILKPQVFETQAGCMRCAGTVCWSVKHF